VSSIAPDPADFAPAWFWLLGADLARHAQRDTSRFVQLATVRADGRPANRSLVFRHFASRGRLVFTSDVRSEKASELAHKPWAEACWYFQDARVQWRLLGRCELEADPADPEIETLRKKLWAELPPATRASFLWPAPGGQRSPRKDFRVETPDMPPDAFQLLVLEPEQVERLDLREAPHRRQRWDFDRSGWASHEINP
jgi:PPOX class probable FMN-dependent enzyme